MWSKKFFCDFLIPFPNLHCQHCHSQWQRQNCYLFAVLSPQHSNSDLKQQSSELPTQIHTPLLIFDLPFILLTSYCASLHSLLLYGSLHSRISSLPQGLCTCSPLLKMMCPTSCTPGFLSSFNTQLKQHLHAEASLTTLSKAALSCTSISIPAQSLWPSQHIFQSDGV